METLEMKNVSIVLRSDMKVNGKENGQETSDRILKAAHELFYSYGIRSITMDDIARHLSISKKTIYLFFNDKHQIVEEACRRDLDSHTEKIHQIAKNAKDAIIEILNTMDFLGDMFSKMNPNLIYDLQKYHPAAWDHFHIFREQQLLGAVEANLKKGIKQGLYRADLNVRILAKLRIEEVQLGMNPTIFAPTKFNLQEVQLTLLEHFLYGILTIEGIKLLGSYNRQYKIKKPKIIA
ncbi:MAG: TetR/AcrR family transcriptional regulator [Chitinophagales bacterium]|nr:TetR/AcrR family transcriptional regulator [Chitinophagales bacterium]